MLVLCELCLYANFGSKILESFAYFVASTNFGNPVDLYVPVVLASASHPIGDWLLLLEGLVVARFIASLTTNN